LVGTQAKQLAHGKEKKNELALPDNADPKRSQATQVQPKQRRRKPAMSIEAMKAIKMVYANTTKHDWPDDIWDAICQAIESEVTDLDAICQDLQEKTYTQAMRIAELEAKLAKAEKQEPVTWGVDWGKAGNTPCVSIIKRLLDGRIEVVAVEYAPYTNPKLNVTISDMKQEHVDKTAKQRHEENT